MSTTAIPRFFARLVAVAILASAPLSYAERTDGRPVRETRTADHIVFPGAYDKVLKVPHPAEWREGRLVLVVGADRARFAKESERASETLRTDAGFLGRFGRIVPRVRLEHDSWIEQGTRSGAPLRDLEGKRERTARSEMAAAIEMASKLVGAVDSDPARFTFDSETGKINGWYAAPPPPAGVATGFSLVKLIGEGANARAFEVRSDDPRTSLYRVIKVLKPYAPRRTPVEAPQRVLDALSREAEFLAGALSADTAFAKRFGDIIPKTQALAPGVIAQEMAVGRSFDQLDHDAQERARDEIKELRAMVRRIAPGVVVTGRTKNYLFKTDGRIASLYDIASDGRRAYEKAGLAERVFAHKNSADHGS